MSLKDFVNGVTRHILGASARGYSTPTLVVCPDGEKTIMCALAREVAPMGVDIVPVLKIAGAAVKVFDAMPKGHVWYVHTGGKK